MAKQTFWQKIGRLFSGNKGGSKKTAPKPRQNKDEREVVSSKSYTSPRRVVLNTMRGNGGGGTEKEKPTYKSMAEATSNKSSLSKLDSALKKDVPDPKRAAAQKSQERAKANLGKAKDALRDNAKYLGNDTERETIAAIKKWNDSNKQQKKEFNERTNHKYDVKYWEEKGDKKKAQEARIRVKSGENTSDVVAEELAVKYHPTAGSAARGAASGATFGLSELAIKSQTKHDKERAKNEQYYQEHKNKTAETVGELAGAFASFGATAGATDRLGAKVVSKVAPNAAERLAETKGVQLLAKRGVNKAVEKGLVGEASEELIKQVGKAKAKKIVAAVGNDIVQNATTGLLYDFNKASAAHEVGSKEWWKEMGRSAAFNAAVTGGIAGGAILGGNKKLAAEEAMNLFNRKNKQAAEDAFKNYMWAERGVGAGNLPEQNGRLFGKSIDERIAKQDAKDRLAKKMRDGNSLIDRANTLDEELAGNPIKGGISIRDLAEPRTTARAQRMAKGQVFDRAAAGEEALDRAAMLDGAYGDIRRGVLPPSEIGMEHPNVTRPYPNPLNIDPSIEGITRPNIPPLDKTGRVRRGELNALFDEASGNVRLADGSVERPLDSLVNIRRGASDRLEEVNRELDEIYDEIQRNGRVMPNERMDALTKRFDELMAERNSLEESIKPAAKAAEKGVEKGAKSAAENLEPRDFTKDLAGNQPKKKYIVEATYKSGRTYKKPIEASSEAEALDIIAEQKGVKTAKVVGSSEITPKGTKSAAENLQTKELTQEEKRNNILNFIGEGDEAAPAVEATAKGAKPEAKVLTSPYEETIANNPKTVDELGDHIGVKHEKVSNKEKTRDFWSSFRTKFVDSLDAYEQWNKQFLKTDPAKWAENNGAIDKLRRHQGMAVKSIDTNQLGWNGQPLKNEDGSIAKSLKAIYDGLDEEKENLFERYLLLRHAPARIAEGKPIFKGTFENADKCIEEAEKILADNPDFAKRADELYRYTRNELQNRVDAGLLPQEVADDWFKRYPNYVPTGRVGEFRPDEDIWEVAHDLARNGNTVKAGEIKSASGSDLDVRSIKEQLSEATTRNWRDMSLNNLLRKMYGEKIGKQLAVEADGGLATVLDNTVNLKSGKGGKYYAEVFEDGKATRVEIEKRFYDAIKDLNKNGSVGDAIDFASDVAAKLSTPFKNVVTSWNPIFMVKNGMRDFPEAVINSRNTKEFMECMDIARRDLYGVEGGGMWTQALRNQGVSQANFVNLEEALTKGGDNIFKKGADKFATLQESVETYPRLVEFMATIKKLNGGTLPESLDNVPMEWLDIAAANAADVTVNFGRSGSIGKMLNRGFVPFFNPSVQGFDKFIRNLSQQPSGKALLSTITKAFALGTGATAINNMLLSDNPYYQQIAAREKATNIIIACPIKFEDGKVSLVDKDEANIFIKIPKSRFAAAYSIPMVNVANDNKMGWAEMIKVAGDQVAPVNPVESNILAPFVLAAKNETWYGTPIVSQGIENKTNPSQEYDANTSLIGKALGKATSKLPTELQISPKKADYILDATTGVIGDFVLPALTPSRQGDGGFVNKYITHPAGNVVKRAFTIDANTQNDLSTRFYNELQKATDNSNSEIGTKEDKEEYKRLNAYSKETAGINQAIRYLQGSDSPTKQKDIYELQKVRNQLMQDALDGKGVPTSEKMLNAVQKYVGTTYAVDSFGSSADKEAMKVYGEAKYGNLSKDEMQKRIDSDKEFLNGVRAIGGLEDKMDKEGIKGTSVLSKAVALASADASDDMFGAYKCTKQSRTETADKMTRARDYIKNGGSDEEFVQLEKARKTMGKLSDFDKDAELEKIDSQLANGEISYEEYYNKQGEIKYNANISRVGLATSLAQANAPQRAYKLYDIKDRNIQKGINLAAMGYSARDYREMAKAVDTSGNGYLSKQEVVDYVANSGVKDKATLFDALYPYDIKYNPFGRATNYSVSQAAEAGNRNGVASIGGSNNDFKISANSGSSGSSYGGYGGYRSYGYGGGGGRKAKVPTIDAKSMAAATKKAKGTTVKLEPPTPKTTKVATKFKKYEV